MEKYKIVSQVENYDESGQIYVKVQVNGTHSTFINPVCKLYKEEALNNFSKEDAAHLAVLYVSQKEHEPDLITKFPVKKKRLTRHVIFLAMLFISFLILSNLTASKLVEFKIASNWSMTLPAALIFFPITYFFNDALTEVYGFSVSRLIIWGGLACNLIFVLGLILTIYLPASPFWQHQSSYATVFGAVPRILLASSLGYFFGEFINSTILAKLKILTKGRKFWLRVVTSTAIGVGVDSLIFCMIAFYGKIPFLIIIKVILTQYVLKVGYEIVLLPVTYAVTNYLKRKDNIDYYDYKTRFNPFSVKMD